MNRTSKRIICLSVQTLDQPSISPIGPKNWHPKLAPTSRREFTGLRNHIKAGPKDACRAGFFPIPEPPAAFL
jgi:hypothetical protein